MKVIARKDMEVLSHVTVDGMNRELGTVKIFSSVPALAEFVPKSSGLAMSWVHLKGGQQLAAHRHDESSMIIIAEGTAEIFGDLQQLLTAGDIVVVPPRSLHGFRGMSEGFWALSVQFGGEALYENPDRPNVSFENEAENGAIQRLIKKNSVHTNAFRSSALIRLLWHPAMGQVAVRERLLDCLQSWSDHFQRLLHLRVALTQAPAHLRVAQDHLREEQGHNDNLRAQRGGRGRDCWDAAMQSAMSWFSLAMITGSDLERTVLMHLVIERSGEVFHAVAAEVFKDMPHFREHGEEDGAHVQQGITLLEHAPSGRLVDLEGTLDDGWNIMTLLCDRMAYLANSVSAVPLEPVGSSNSARAIVPA